MKRSYLWAVIAAGLLLAGELPMETHDAAELLPAELAIFWTEDGRVCARCDNGTEGSGEDLDAALDDLERAAEGVLFLDTAEHLILCGDIPSLAKQAADCGRLRPAAKVYRMADAALSGRTFGAEPELLRAMTVQQVQDRLAVQLLPDRMAISVVNPLESTNQQEG